MCKMVTGLPFEVTLPETTITREEVKRAFYESREQANNNLIDYIVNILGGEIKADGIYASTYGEGRIQVITAYKAPTETEDGYMDILQGTKSIRKVIKLTAADNSETKEQTFTKELTKDSEIVSSEDFALILTENVTKNVVIKNADGVTFTFIKGSMNAVDGKSEYDFGTSIIADYSKATALSTAVTKENFVLQLDYNYSGQLPAKATITLNVGSELAGKTLYYYLYNADKTYKLVQRVVVDDEGLVSVTQEHCSTYVLTSAELVLEQETITETITNGIPGTGDGTMVWLFVAMLIASICAMAVLKKTQRA